MKNDLSKAVISTSMFQSNTPLAMMNIRKIVEGTQQPNTREIIPKSIPQENNLCKVQKALESKIRIGNPLLHELVQCGGGIFMYEIGST